MGVAPTMWIIGICSVYAPATPLMALSSPTPCVVTTPYTLAVLVLIDPDMYTHTRPELLLHGHTHSAAYAAFSSLALPTVDHVNWVRSWHGGVDQSSHPKSNQELP